MNRILLLVLLGTCVILGAVLGFYNAVPVRFDFLLGQVEWPLIALLAASFAVGILIAAAFSSWRLVALRLSLRRTQKQLQQAETELRNLRNLPIQTDSRSGP